MPTQQAVEGGRPRDRAVSAPPQEGNRNQGVVTQSGGGWAIPQMFPGVSSSSPILHIFTAIDSTGVERMTWATVIATRVRRSRRTRVWRGRGRGPKSWQPWLLISTISHRSTKLKEGWRPIMYTGSENGMRWLRRRSTPLAVLLDVLSVSIMVTTG